MIKDLLIDAMDYEKYPDPELARMMDEVKINPSLCVACNSSAHYVVPAFCPQHYPQWLSNRKRFEKMFYRGKEW
jgi:hypothetical protein